MMEEETKLSKASRDVSRSSVRKKLTVISGHGLPVEFPFSVQPESICHEVRQTLVFTRHGVTNRGRNCRELSRHKPST